MHIIIKFNIIERTPMVNQIFIDDKKIKDILIYISGINHAEQIRMMFLCSLNGMRSINFTYLQVGDNNWKRLIIPNVLYGVKKPLKLRLEMGLRRIS